MTTCSAPTHSDHAHQHGPGCGHPAVRHGGHTDYLHDGHLHHPHEGHVDEHAQTEAASEIFRALGDPERLRLLLRLAEREGCVSELAEDEGEKITTVSARLKTLSVVRLVRRRREAKHVFYALADEHVLPLVRNAIYHAAESRIAVSADLGHGKDTIP